MDGRRSTLRESAGFTLVEVLVGVTVFTIVALGAYEGYLSITNIARLARLKLAAVALGNEQLEIARNLPYADVGIVGGIPPGRIPRTQSLVRGGTTFGVHTTVRNIDDPFDGMIGGAPNDTAPADYKLVELTVSCPSCPRFTPVTLETYVAPSALETETGNGTLVVRVLDANGQPVAGAAVHMENPLVTPPVVIDETTNAQGVLQVVEAPPGNEVYAITVSKEGYSSERTYPSGAPENPNPTKPHATVSAGTVTQVSFAIDRLSTLDVTSVRDTCMPVDSVALTLRGAKLIGTDPDVPKYTAAHVTDLSGRVAIPNLEWDTYDVTLTSPTYDLRGAVPLLPVTVIPNTVQALQLVVAPKESSSLLVTVRDQGTHLPLDGATVTMALGGTPLGTQTTGRGFLRQTDWSGGGGQEAIGDLTRYSGGDGNIADASPPGELRLRPGATSGELKSSTFDAGTTTEFHEILWQPRDQPPAAGPGSVRFQIATNKNLQAAWNYLGPDGSKVTFYTVADTSVSTKHKGDRYFRYRVLLQTADVSVSPNLSEVAFTFTSSCVPPGQVLFGGIATGEVTLTVLKLGYQTFTDTVTIVPGWQKRDVFLGPQ